MRIALIGASGRAGSQILKELVRRAHQVTAIARNISNIAPHPSVTARKGDVQNKRDLGATLKGHDAVVSAVHFSATDPRLLIGAVRDAGVKRYLVVGGAGSLELAPGVLLVNTPDFPAEYKAEATKGLEFLNILKTKQDLDWTFLSPSAYFFEGERTGKFRLGRDQLIVNGEGSRISFADYAIAMVDEIENPAHIRQRFTVGY